MSRAKNISRHRRDGVVVRASTSQSVDLGFTPYVESYQKTLKMVFTASLLGAQHKKGLVRRTSRPACLLCPWARHLTGRLHLYVEDRWPSRTSSDYNCEVANPACQTTLGGTHEWQSALLVVGLPVTQDWFEMSCHLSPSLISIRFTA